MVYALEEIRWLLKPGGFLINIQPVPNWLFLKVVKGGEVVASEPRPMMYCQDVLDAEDAIARVLERNLFVVEQTQDFDFITYASTVDELRSHWEKISAFDDSPEDEFILQQEEEQYARFHTILQAAGDDSEILVHEKGRISRLKPVR